VDGSSEEGALRISPTNMLSLFYKKFNKILLDKLVLEQELSRLNEENGHLEGVLGQYLDGLTVNDQVLSGDNPLVIVNGRANLTSTLTASRSTVSSCDCLSVLLYLFVWLV